MFTQMVCDEIKERYMLDSIVINLIKWDFHECLMTRRRFGEQSCNAFFNAPKRPDERAIVKKIFFKNR